MKRFLLYAGICAVLVALSGVLAQGQFGLGGIKKKIDQATQPAKTKVDDANRKTEPAKKNAERAFDTFADWTSDQEQQIGDAAAAKMIAVLKLTDAPDSTRYLNLVGSSVAQFAPRQVPYRFGILDSDLVGAFSLPGGYIFVTRQALQGMHNEAELAAVLAHEIVHVSERHLERETRANKSAEWAKEVARSKATGLIDGLPSVLPKNLVDKISDDLVRGLVELPLTREKEEAADKQGVDLAVQTGYSADGLVQFLQTMAAAQTNPANTDSGKMFGMLTTTHPKFPERIAYLTPIVTAAPKGGKTLETRFASSLR